MPAILSLKIDRPPPSKLIFPANVFKLDSPNNHCFNPSLSGNALLMSAIALATETYLSSELISSGSPSPVSDFANSDNPEPSSFTFPLKLYKSLLPSHS